MLKIRGKVWLVVLAEPPPFFLAIQLPRLAPLAGCKNGYCHHKSQQLKCEISPDGNNKMPDLLVREG